MGTFNFEELAIRSAINTAPKTISPDSHNCSAIKENAQTKVKNLMNGTNSGIDSELDPKTTAIGLAAEGLRLGYEALKDQLTNLKDKRLSFDKERQAGIATFLMPTNKEESVLSKQERVIKSFLNLVEQNNSFKNYFGIHTSTLSDMPNTIFYSVLPFYRMSEQLPQPTASERPIDKVKISINLFFKSALPDSIADIDNEFRNGNKFAEFWMAAYKKDNYLNDLRSQRFIIMCLANLLWNLQHPVNPNSGFQLDLKASIQLCTEVGLFLNLLLNSSKDTYLKQINTSNKHLLVSFARRVENHIKSLKAAFIQQQLYELNMRYLNNSAHESLRIMDQSIFKLIYSRVNPITKKNEPDNNAACNLIDTISHLTQILTYNPQLIQSFTPFTQFFEKPPFLNVPGITIIDVLIIFTQSTNENREEIFKSLGKNKTDNAEEFIASLKIFNSKFVKPIKSISKQELGSTFFEKKSKEAATLTTKRLLPFITLALEDYRITIETPESLEAIKQAKIKNPKVKKYSAKEQMMEINKQAHQGDGFYIWRLSPYINLSTGTEAALDELPKYQHRFAEITKLLDAVSEIVEKYRSFLQIKSFQQFLIKCLNKIKEEYLLLGRHIDNIDTLLSQDQLISRNMQSILGPMGQDLMKGLSSFSNAFNDFEHIVCDPNFIEQQKQLLSSKIKAINQHFITLFNEESGLLDCISQDCLEHPIINTITKPTDNSSTKTPFKPITINDVLHPETIKQPATSLPSPSPTAKEEITHELNPSSPAEILTLLNTTPAVKLLPLDTTDKGLLDTNPEPVNIPVQVDKPIDAIRIAALKKLINQCYEGLSYPSKYSGKGRLLTNLLDLINKNSSLTEEKATQAIKELARITLSYRSTYFFQAAYGETRSGKIFIAAIKDPKLNNLLPIASLMFGYGVNVAEESNEFVIGRCKSIQEENHWPESASQIDPIAVL